MRLLLIAALLLPEILHVPPARTAQYRQQNAFDCLTGQPLIPLPPMSDADRNRLLDQLRQACQP